MTDEVSETSPTELFDLEKNQPELDHGQYLRDVFLNLVYRDTIMKLTILKSSVRPNTKNTQPRRRRTSHKTSLDSIKPNALAEYLKEEVEDMLDESILNALKFERDIDTLTGIFEAAYRDLCSYDELKDISVNLGQEVEALRLNSNQEAVARVELQTLRDKLQMLKDDFERQRTEGSEGLHDIEERIADTKHQLKCVHRVNELEYNLVERWEASRQMQAIIWGENHERAYLCAIIDYKRRFAAEQRIMKEVAAFREREFGELRKQLAAWQVKYANELNCIDNKIERQEDCIAQLHKSLKRHREVYEQRVTFVHEYEQQKIEEQRQLALQMHRVECAIRIQAWWRGVMVRRGLGPFKRKPKKGKKAKGKGR